MIVGTEVRRLTQILAIALIGLIPAGQSSADEGLAKQLNNPVSDLISFPIQSNYDFNVGPADGWRSTTNVQPVIPIKLSEDWNLISRTIVPVIYQNDAVGNSGSQFGLSDSLQSLFLSPQNPTQTPIGNLIWGVGPAIEIPTSTDERLGLGTFGMGPTGVALIQEGPWTFGALANHVWGIAETRSNRPALNNTFMQPFVAYTTKDAWTFSINSELSYNWTASELSGPMNFGIAKVTRIGGQAVQFTGRLRYHVAQTAASPEGVGFTAQVTFIFPE